MRTEINALIQGTIGVSKKLIYILNLESWEEPEIFEILNYPNRVAEWETVKSFLSSNQALPKDLQRHLEDGTKVIRLYDDEIVTYNIEFPVPLEFDNHQLLPKGIQLVITWENYTITVS